MKNKYEVRGEVTAIIINSPKYGRQEALISTNKLGRAIEFPYSWYVVWNECGKMFYVQANIPIINKGKTKEFLHRWVTDAPQDMVVDHFNGDGLINTDENLRIVTQGQNIQNRKGATKASTSGVRGVTWSKERKRWIAQVWILGKNKKIGRFTNKDDAEKAVKEARSRLMPYSHEAS